MIPEHIAHPQIWSLWANQVITVLDTLLIVYILRRK